MDFFSIPAINEAYANIRVSSRFFVQAGHETTYRTRATITRSWFETALIYKPRILDQKIEEFPCLVHKLSVTLTALQYKPQWKVG